MDSGGTWEHTNQIIDQIIVIMSRCNVERPSLHALLVAFLCLCFFQPTAGAEPLQGKEISISVRKSSLSSILNQISKKSGITIYFVDTDLSGYTNIDYDAKDKEVTNILAELFKGKNLQYEVISEKQIGVRKIKGKAVVSEEYRDTLVTVTGKVTDEKGTPVVGATVVSKGNTKLGTTTNSEGKFVLGGVKYNASLVISSVSFLTAEIPIRGRQMLGRVILKEYVGILDETIVMAYGTTTKRLNTGNIASVQAEEIERQPVNNPLYALQGRVAGLQITPTTGLAGGAIKVQIRGNNSLTFTTTPLIVVDGLPVVNNVNGYNYGPLGEISALNFISPNDIESIDVLKDADATSIYGSRGANGVILITTKKGKEGRTNFNINIQQGIADVPKKIDMLDTKEYIKLRREAFLNSGVDFLNTFPYGVEDFKYIVAPDLFVWDSTSFTDWQDVLIGKTAQYSDVNTSISGGTSTVQYLIGGNYHRETTVFPGHNSDQKGSVHVNVTGMSLDKRLKTSLSASYMIDNNKLPGIDFTSQSLIGLAPNAPNIKNEDGTLNWAVNKLGTSSWSNPFAELERQYETKISNLLAGAEVGYHILESLNFKTQLGYNLLRGTSFKSGGTLASTPPENINSNLTFDADFNSNEVKNISIEPQLNYKAKVGFAKIDVLFGAALQQTTIQNNFLSALGFKDETQVRNWASATTFRGSNTSSDYKYNAVFGRININLANKYIFNLTARRDGSSRFGPGNRFGNFGSVAGAWILSEEKFLKEATPFISFAKFRASYGTSGNDRIADYAYLEQYQPIPGLYYQGSSGTRTTGLFNDYYHWETTRKLELGLETGLIKDRIFLNFMFFRNRSGNQLLSTSYASTAGPGSAVINLPALIQNSGFEFTGSAVNFKTKTFTWTTSANLTVSRNKLISFPDLERSNYYSLFEEGQPFFGVDKVFNVKGVNTNTGKYEFIGNDGKTVDNPNDPTALDGGKYIRVMTTPKYYGGLSNSLTFKGFSLEVFLQYTKQIGSSFLRNYVQIAGLAPSNLPKEYVTRWQLPGDMSKFQRVVGLFDNELYQSNAWWLSSNAAYEDASFIRVKNIALSYTVQNSKEKFNISMVRLYIQAQNLLTFSPYTGLDPEVQSIGSLPPLRVLTAGIQATF